MTHLPGIPMKFDPPDEWKSCVAMVCACGSKEVWSRTHTASDGGVEDEEYQCRKCGFTWWVDGIDS